MDHIITILYSSSAVAGFYIGWKQGPLIKSYINNSSLNIYKERLFNFKGNKIISEDVFYSITGALTGMLIGRYTYPFFVPYSMYYIEKHHGEYIRKMLK